MHAPALLQHAGAQTQHTYITRVAPGPCRSSHVPSTSRNSSTIRQASLLRVLQRDTSSSNGVSSSGSSGSPGAGRSPAIQHNVLRPGTLSTLDSGIADVAYWDLLSHPDMDDSISRAKSASDAAVLRRKGHLKEQDNLIEFMRRMHETHTCEEVMAKMERWVSVSYLDCVQQEGQQEGAEAGNAGCQCSGSGPHQCRPQSQCSGCWLSVLL